VFPHIGLYVKPVTNAMLSIEVDNLLKFEKDTGYFQFCPTLVGHQWGKNLILINADI